MTSDPRTPECRGRAPSRIANSAAWPWLLRRGPNDPDGNHTSPRETPVPHGARGAVGQPPGPRGPRLSECRASLCRRRSPLGCPLCYATGGKENSSPRRRQSSAGFADRQTPTTAPAATLALCCGGRSIRRWVPRPASPQAAALALANDATRQFHCRNLMARVDRPVSTSVDGACYNGWASVRLHVVRGARPRALDLPGDGGAQRADGGAARA